MLCNAKEDHKISHRIALWLNECSYPIEIKVKIFLRVGSKKDIETNTPSENPEGVGQLNRC
ncbi:hypothetical protein DAE08_13790 [Escherichia coli]|nr:hypothetical protein [Escherichia coli]HAJ7234868.1 hypothetical protein [Escherichia coli]